ncbi:hypothetical protein [Streptomyces sp. B6B3]|uniref:hypothetical protein n=1 Tax=Streptomyces sp. B6B3 TaxID=3153570 RepID=UPI00325DD326
MSRPDRSALPPVRLPSEGELAREALATVLFSRAVRLARWSAPGIPVGPGGELPAQQLKAAVTRLHLDGDEEGPAHAGEAWVFALEAGLVVVDEGPEAESADPLELPLTLDADVAATGVASPGADLDRVAGGRPAEVLDIWSDGVDAVLAEVAFAGVESYATAERDDSEESETAHDEDDEDADHRAPHLAEPELLEDLDRLHDLGGHELPEGLDADELDLEDLDWDPEEEADLLDSALGTLYLFTTSDEDVAAGAMVPLPMVAAAVVMPEGVEEPSDEVLDDMSAVLMRLDEQFRALDGTGLLEYQPAEESAAEAVELLAAGAGTEGAADDDALDLDRFGRVRLTPLGLYGVRRRMVEAGLDAPVVGDLRNADAGELLAAIPYRPESAAREESELWLAEREPLDAARLLLAAARGADEEGPGRRLGCQLVLSLVDGRGEEALREVLGDRELGGLARVWLAERGAVDIPPPDEDMVFWLTIDTLAAQLDTPAEQEEAAELGELMRDLTGQHGEFFDRAWRSEHPATAEVLEAMGRLHPDRQLAKQARKAAFKARSRAAG